MLFVLFCPERYGSEEAKYSVVHQNVVYEVRRYVDRLVAQVAYDGENSINTNKRRIRWLFE